MTRPVIFRNHHGIQFRQCADCDGAGERTIRHPSGNPELEDFERCHDCGGRGDFRVTPVDVLELLNAERRLMFAMKSSPSLWAGVRRRYIQRRAAAMKRVALPRFCPDSYHARLRLTDPVAAEVFATVFRAMGFAA